MSDDVQRAITNAREELVRRMNDEVEIRKIPPLTLVRVADFLASSKAGPLTQFPLGDIARQLGIADVDFVRSLGLPDVRQAELLAHLLGVTAEEAASLLASDAGQEEQEPPEPEGV